MNYSRLLLAGVLLLSTSAPALCSNSNSEKPTRASARLKTVADNKKTQKTALATAVPKKPTNNSAKKTSVGKAPAAKKAPGIKRVEPSPEEVMVALDEQTFKQPVVKKKKWLDEWNSTKATISVEDQEATPQDAFTAAQRSSVDFSSNSSTNLLDAEETGPLSIQQNKRARGEEEVNGVDAEEKAHTFAQKAAKSGSTDEDKRAKIDEVTGAEEPFSGEPDPMMDLKPFAAGDKLLKEARTVNDYITVIALYATHCKGSVEAEATQRIANVYFILSKLYASGSDEHIPKDTLQSYQYHKDAYRLGHQEAIETYPDACYDKAMWCLQNASDETTVKTGLDMISWLAGHKNHALAHGTLADIFSTGQFGVPKDLHKAIKHSQKAAESLEQAKEQLHDLRCELAESYLSGDVEQMQEAIDLLATDVAAGHVSSKDKLSQAVLSLGKRYWLSEDQPRGRERAIQSLESNAKRSPEAKPILIAYLGELSDMHLYGRSGIKQNRERAIQLMEQAIRWGATHLSTALVTARIELAECYMLGINGCSFDINRCFQILINSPQDHPEVRSMLGRAKYKIAMYKFDISKSKRSKANPSEARKLLQKASQSLYESANLGNADARYMLGLFLYHGEHTFPKSSETALTFLNQAASDGHEKAKAIVGEVSFSLAQEIAERSDTNARTASDYEKMMDLLTAAAERGHIKAPAMLKLTCYEYAMSLYGGKGATDEAMIWLKKAAEMGHPEAQYHYACELATRGDVSAPEWFTKPKDQGISGTMIEIASGLSEGRGMPQNIGESLRLALMSGHESAKDLFAKHIRFNPKLKGEAAVQPANSHGFLDDINLDSTAAFAPLTEFLVKLKTIFVELQSSPIMVRVLELSKTARIQLAQQKAPALICEDVINDVPYLTVGPQNIARQNKICAFLQEGLIVEDLNVKPLASYLLGKAQEMVATAEKDDDLAKKLEKGAVYALPNIQNLDHAKMWSALLIRGHTKALKKLAGEKATFEKWFKGGAHVKKKSLREFEHTKQILEEQQAWARQVEDNLNLVDGQFKKCLEDSTTRDEAARVDTSYRPILKAFELQEDK